MNKAFAQDDENQTTDLLDRPLDRQPNYLTPAGYAALKRRVDELHVRHAQLLSHDGSPMSQELLAEAERDLRYWTARLDAATVVDPTTQPHDEVHFGAHVTVQDAEGQQHQFEIVGEDEMEPGNGRIGWQSPLARALLGSRVGDNAVWVRPVGDLALQVRAIRYG